MISNKSGAFLSTELVESIELTSKVTSVGLECFSYSGKDFLSLLVCDTWSKRVVSEVTANTDTG